MIREYATKIYVKMKSLRVAQLTHNQSLQKELLLSHTDSINIFMLENIT